LFAVLGFGSIVPVTHCIVIDNILAILSVPTWLPLMVALYLVGGFTYAVRFPECLLPGTFDIWVLYISFSGLLSISLELSQFRSALYVNLQEQRFTDCMLFLVVLVSRAGVNGAAPFPSGVHPVVDEERMGDRNGIQPLKLDTSQEIGWEEHLRNDLFYVEWDVKP